MFSHVDDIVPVVPEPFNCLAIHTSSATRFMQILHLLDTTSDRSACAATSRQREDLARQAGMRFKYGVNRLSATQPVQDHVYKMQVPETTGLPIITLGSETIIGSLMTFPPGDYSSRPLFALSLLAGKSVWPEAASNSCCQR